MTTNIPYELKSIVYEYAISTDKKQLGRTCWSWYSISRSYFWNFYSDTIKLAKEIEEDSKIFQHTEQVKVQVVGLFNLDKVELEEIITENKLPKRLWKCRSSRPCK